MPAEHTSRSAAMCRSWRSSSSTGATSRCGRRVCCGSNGLVRNDSGACVRLQRHKTGSRGSACHDHLRRCNPSSRSRSCLNSAFNSSSTSGVIPLARRKYRSMSEYPFSALAMFRSACARWPMLYAVSATVANTRQRSKSVLMKSRSAWSVSSRSLTLSCQRSPTFRFYGEKTAAAEPQSAA